MAERSSISISWAVEASPGAAGVDESGVVSTTTVRVGIAVSLSGATDAAVDFFDDATGAAVDLRFELVGWAILIAATDATVAGRGAEVMPRWSSGGEGDEGSEARGASECGEASDASGAN